MLNADKYIDRLRVIIKSNEQMKINKDFSSMQRLEFITYRIKDVIKDYDEDFNKALEHHNTEKREMFNMKRDNPFKEGTN